MPEITMPKMGDAMEEGTLREWLKKEGEPVAEQEPIATIETEKSTIEIPSFYTGQIVRILVQPGQTVPVGTPIAVIDTGEEDAAEEKAAEPKAAEPAKKPAEAAAPAGETPQLEASRALARPSPTDGGARVKASPLARKVAAQRGVDLTQVRGTGPGGRIVEADVEGFLRAKGAPAEAPPREAPAEVVPSERPPHPPAPRPLGDGAFTERELSTMRRTIARRLVESKQQIPHYYVTSAIDMGAVAKLRDQINDLRGDAPSYTDFITRACALALKQFPTVNAQFVDGKLREFSGAHIGVAVALPEGLIVPVVRDADRKSLSQISDEIRTLAERARAGQLKPEEYSGGTFTLSNLGMFDVEDFIGVINPPEVALLAVGAVKEEPVVKGGQVSVGLRMRVTLSADHRIIDGAVAAQFLQAVKRYLQEPLLLM